MSRILAIDYGQKRIGVAISDEMAILALPLKTLDQSEAISEIVKIVDEEEIETLVVGLPRQIDGSMSEEAPKVMEFVDKLKEKILTNVKIELEDETATSVLAEERLKERGENFRIEKEKVDLESAVIILESYLIEKGNKP